MSRILQVECVHAYCIDCITKNLTRF
ncbi:hypothetical protein [uncultured Methylophaga sp.]